jgi:hypothetical protein
VLTLLAWHEMRRALPHHLAHWMGQLQLQQRDPVECLGSAPAQTAGVLRLPALLQHLCCCRACLLLQTRRCVQVCLCCRGMPACRSGSLPLHGAEAAREWRSGGHCRLCWVAAAGLSWPPPPKLPVRQAVLLLLPPPLLLLGPLLQVLGEAEQRAQSPEAGA